MRHMGWANQQIYKEIAQLPDEALAAYQGAASAPGRAAMGAMGYLSKGLQKGVYR